jgi:hypothetical protein
MVFETAVQDADEPVDDLTQGGIVCDVAASKLLVVGADVGIMPDGGANLHVQGID